MEIWIVMLRTVKIAYVKLLLVYVEHLKIHFNKLLVSNMCQKCYNLLLQEMVIKKVGNGYKKILLIFL
jgi:hypothetical protein